MVWFRVYVRLTSLLLSGFNILGKRMRHIFKSVLFGSLERFLKPFPSVDVEVHRHRRKLINELFTKSMQALSHLHKHRVENKVLNVLPLYTRITVDIV